MLYSRRDLRLRNGYSLIELVVVLMVLAIVAGLTVAIVDWMRRAADKATGSNVIAALLSNVQLYRTTYSEYPDQFDSLVDSGSGAAYGDLHADLAGKLTFQTLTADQVASLTKVGIKNVMDHVKGSGTEGFPGNSGTVRRAIDTTGKFAVVTDPEVIDSIYPPLGGVSGSGKPIEVTLVALAFGPGCTANGKTIAAPPIYSGVGDLTTKYSRFVCVFAVYDPRDGRRAQIKGVLDSKGDFLSQELAEFYNNNPK